MVGLTSQHRHTWQSLPRSFKTYLTSRRQWLMHVKSYRDSLAHRIPLYIPPYTVDPKVADDYQRLENESLAALLSGDLLLHEQLSVEQDRLKRFSPFMVHSMNEHSPTALFHPQMLADFHTIEGFGNRLLAELKGQTDEA
jgi:abortive infection bacteriophage resistance protein